MFGLFKKKSASPKNDGVRKALAAHGDDGTLVRHVIHFAYPLDDRDPGDKDAARAIVNDEIEVTYTETDDSPGIVFEHYREVASGGFDDLTNRLEDRLATIGWDYDGWECAVATGVQE
ncbi:MAG: hypothetical protein HKN18_16690 [Silicimonas sp.]|nr:hypothetical protein [Silicimonas sp.]